MASGGISKQDRQMMLMQKLKQEPFLTDGELAEFYGVSIQTIRLDRLELGIPELRERIKIVAENNYSKVKSITSGEIVGELIDLSLGKNAISMLQTTGDMVFEKTRIVRGHYMFAQANSLAIAVINADVALTGVANIKYKVPVFAGEKLIAKAQVTKKRGNKHFVWVKTYVKNKEVFRGKFILVAIEGEEHYV